MSHFSFKMFHPRKDERIHQVLQVHHKMPYGLSTASDKARSLQASGEQPPGLTPVSSHPTSGSFIDKIRKVSTFKVYFLHCKKLHSLKIKMNKIALCTDGDNLIFLGIRSFPSTHTRPVLAGVYSINQQAINFNLFLYCLKNYPLSLSNCT